MLRFALIALLVLAYSSDADVRPESRLLSDVFEYYDNVARPVKDWRTPVALSINMALMNFRVVCTTKKTIHKSPSFRTRKTGR